MFFPCDVEIFIQAPVLFILIRGTTRGHKTAARPSCRDSTHGLSIEYCAYIKSTTWLQDLSNLSVASPRSTSWGTKPPRVTLVDVSSSSFYSIHRLSIIVGALILKLSRGSRTFRIHPWHRPEARVGAQNTARPSCRCFFFVFIFSHRSSIEHYIYIKLLRGTDGFIRYKDRGPA